MSINSKEAAASDSLLRDFESQMHGVDIFGSETPLDVKTFLAERGLLDGVDHSQLFRLLQAQLTHDIRAGHVPADQVLVNTLISQFTDLNPNVVCELAAHEYQLRIETGQAIDPAYFVSEVHGLDDVHRSKLVDDLKRLPYLEPTLHRPPEQTQLDYQFREGDVVNDFRIMRGIGRGGMGEVYLALQLHPIRRTVALKVIQRLGRHSSKHRLRFEAERQAQALMDHPNIAKVYQAGMTESGQAFVAMEYVDGASIVRYCDEHALTVNERLDLFLQTCRAIQHAHEKGIIHRDITPGNVLVAASTSGPTIRVIDFGLAKALQPDVQLTEEEMYSVIDSPLGTYLFMSPEQTGVGNRSTDIRTDVYSLGAVLYLLLTGTPPIADPGFRKKSNAEKCKTICQQETTRPSQRIRENDSASSIAAKPGKSSPGSLYKILHGELDWIVLKALEKDRERRYASVADLAEDIERFLSQRPIKARPPSLRYRLSKAIRRNKGATAALVSLVAGVIGMSYLQLGRWSAEDNARTERERRQQAEFDSLQNKYASETAKQAQRVSERETLLQKLLVTPAGTTSDDNRLLALEKAETSDLITKTDRIDLQLARAEVLHRLQSFDRLYQLLAEIQPVTDQQQGCVAVWKIRKAYRADEQRKLAEEVLQKKDEYQLSISDEGYARSILAASRVDAIQTLDQVRREQPQHESSRKLLITLLLLEGRTQELEQQIADARLLFPGSVDVELAAGLAMAFRGDRNGVELHCGQLKSMSCLSDKDRDFQQKLLILLSRISDTVLSFDVGSGSNSIFDLISSTIELLQHLANTSGVSRLLRDALGSGIEIGQSTTSSGSEVVFLSTVPARILAAKLALTLKQPAAMNGLIADMERMSPIPGDAFFPRLKAYVCLTLEDYNGAARELDLAIDSPCVFPRMKSRMLYEAALCHVQVYLTTGQTDQVKLRRAGELSLRWAEETDEFDPVATQRVQNILNLNGQFDAALRIIDRCRQSNSELPPFELVTDELKTFMNAKRFPEVVQLAERWVASDSGGTVELATFCRKMRDDAMSRMLQLVNDAGNSETTP